ncbi:MAG: DUF192 domain-containing protein [Actinomycetota bacterium]
MLRRYLAPIALLLAIACATTHAGTPGTCPATGTVQFGQHRHLFVQVAQDEASRARGLMGVTTLGADDGMAFRWDSSTTGSFWMKDTLIPLSIAFVDEGGRVISIQEMTPCTADPCDTYEASGPYVMAIEANTGWFDDHAIVVGDPAVFQMTGCV